MNLCRILCELRQDSDRKLYVRTRDYRRPKNAAACLLVRDIDWFRGALLLGKDRARLHGRIGRLRVCDSEFLSYGCQVRLLVDSDSSGLTVAFHLKTEQPRDLSLVSDLKVLRKTLFELDYSVARARGNDHVVRQDRDMGCLASTAFCKHRVVES